MGREMFLSVRFFSNLILITSLLVFIDSCSNSNEHKYSAGSVDWVRLSVKFKANSADSLRGTVIYSIKKLLIDTIKAIRNTPEYKNYNPNITTSFSPFGDSLTYMFSVSVNYPASSDTSSCICECTCAPPCKCPNCGVCENLKVLLGYPSHGMPSLGSIIDTFKVNDSFLVLGK
jgi:hypothetical protein